MNKKIALSLAVGFLVGVLWLVAIRFLLIKNDAIHYHANFGLYVNGVREEFKSPLFYEEVQSCSVDSSNDPKARAHLHNQESSIVHVHDAGATWGHFFANLGFGLTNQAFLTEKETFIHGQNGIEISYFLNGERIDSVTNRVIENEDVLIIWISNITSSFVLPELEKTAHKYNDQLDPAGCSGSEPLTVTTRLRKALGF
jgi:hypothetical protein